MAFSNKRPSKNELIELHKKESVKTNQSDRVYHSSDYPNRITDTGYGYGAAFHDISVFQSGEVEMYGDCLGQSGMYTRSRIGTISNRRIIVMTWSERPRFLDDNGQPIPHSYVEPLRRDALPWMSGNRRASAPAILVDKDYKVATPVIVGPNRLSAYWPRHDSLPMTYGSWLITWPYDEAVNGIKRALRESVIKRAKVNSKLASSMPVGTEMLIREEVARWWSVVSSIQFAKQLFDAWREGGEIEAKRMLDSRLDTPEAIHACAVATSVRAMSWWLTTSNRRSTLNGFESYGVRSGTPLMRNLSTVTGIQQEVKYLTPENMPS